MAESVQTVPHDTWVQSATAPELWMFQNSGSILTIEFLEGGSVKLSYPERWRFARAFRTEDSHGWLAAPDLVPPFPPPIPAPGAAT